MHVCFIFSIKNGAYKYWFYIYNLLHEYLESKDGEDCSKDIIQTIQQFVQNSNYADFSVRMRLLKSFEMYLHYMNGTNTIRKCKSEKLWFKLTLKGYLKALF